MGKIGAGFSFGFIHILIFPLYLSAKFQSKDFRSIGAFFPYSGREAWAKKSFSVAGKIRGSWWLKAVAQKGLCPFARKAFYIIPNYRQRWCWFASNEASAEWKATVCDGNLRIILIM
ncbi:hypothetical protein [Epilithonimonas vandammei]|nr:hypothetical protein [Epilithonimonas vandammei]